MKKQENAYAPDDGRVIASMNVEGMPWYAPSNLSINSGGASSTLSKREARYAIWGALRAALTVVSVLSAGMILFVLFCTQVWFR